MPDFITFIAFSALLALVFFLVFDGREICELLSVLLSAVVYAVVILVFIILIPIGIMMAILGGDNEHARR